MCGRKREWRRENKELYLKWKLMCATERLIYRGNPQRKRERFWLCGNFLFFKPIPAFKLAFETFAKRLEANVTMAMSCVRRIFLPTWRWWEAANVLEKENFFGFLLYDRMLRCNFIKLSIIYRRGRRRVTRMIVAVVLGNKPMFISK